MKIKKFYNQLININGVQRRVISFNYKESKEKEKKVEVERLHHIHILDQSGSMYESIDRLIENVKETINFMEDNDLITVIMFSSKDECKVLLKGATKSPDLFPLLDSMKYTLSTTCFSVPLKKTNEIIDELKLLCPNISVTLFTDGEPVVPHSLEEENKRIFNELSIMKDKILAFNTIGYGNYYNQDLLLNMANTSLFGKMIHSDKIDQYSDIWKRQYETVASCIPESIIIEAEKSDILYITRNNTKLSSDKLDMNYLDKYKNQFYIVLDTNTTEFYINHEEYKVSDIKESKIRKESLNNMLYGLAYEYYYKGDTDIAIDILQDLKDKTLIDNVLNAFTFEEKQECRDALSKAIYDNSVRDNSAPNNYIPDQNAFCIMDLLEILCKDNKNCYIPDSKTYNRIGRKVTDGYNLFESKDEEILSSFANNIVLSSKDLNISVRFKINGSVKLNPRAAKKVGLENEYECVMYRVHTLIKDGNVNVPIIKARVTKETYKELDEKLPLDSLFIDKHDNNFQYIRINLEAIPIINRSYASNKDPKLLLNNVKEYEETKAKIKMLKDLSNIKTEGTINNYTIFTEDQLEVLKEHGLNGKLEYNGVDNNISEKNENDYYMSREITFGIKGFSSLPSNKDVIKKYEDGKKLNAPAQIMANAYSIFKDDSNKAKRELERLNKRKLYLELELNKIKIGKVLTGSWWINLTEDNKGNQIYDELIIKTKRVKKFF